MWGQESYMLEVSLNSTPKFSIPQQTCISTRLPKGGILFLNSSFLPELSHATWTKQYMAIYSISKHCSLWVSLVLNSGMTGVKEPEPSLTELRDRVKKIQISNSGSHSSLGWVERQLGKLWGKWGIAEPSQHPAWWTQMGINGQWFNQSCLWGDVERRGTLSRAREWALV